jgi:GT2 family glycosyltransferase
LAHPVDIIVRAKNGHALTRECLDSVSRNTAAGSYRLILCDDGSDPAYEAAAADFVLRSHTSRGAVSATNMGLALALQLPGDYVIVMDNDTRVPEGDVSWLERFVRELEQVPGTACVGATTGFADIPQYIFAVPQTYTADWKGGKRENPPALRFISFACLLAKRAVRECGLWDERYNPGNYEDTDYALQLRQAGWQIRVARSVYIHHKGHATFADGVTALLAENHGKFLKKWGMGRLWDMGIIPSARLYPVIRELMK